MTCTFKYWADTHILLKKALGFYLYKRRDQILVTGDYDIWEIPQMLHCWWLKVHKSIFILTGLLIYQMFSSKKYVSHLPFDKYTTVKNCIVFTALGSLAPEEFSQDYLSFPRWLKKTFFPFTWTTFVWDYLYAFIHMMTFGETESLLCMKIKIQFHI